MVLSVPSDVARRLSDPTSLLNWWDSVLWDVLAVRMVISLDLVWNDLTNTEKSTYANWLDTLCTSVAVLHTKDINSGYYKSNDCGGNIKFRHAHIDRATR